MITNDQIETLQTEAAAHGDAAMDAICRLALGADDTGLTMTVAQARAKCEQAIDAAKAMEDGEETLVGTIYERGNGLPDPGEYVSGNDGNVYRVARLLGRISTNGPGMGNSVEAVLELADWSDLDDDDEPYCAVVLRDESEDAA